MDMVGLLLQCLKLKSPVSLERSHLPCQKTSVAMNSPQD